MEQLRYIVIALAVVDFLLLLVRPRLGFLGLILLLPFVNRFIPRVGPGLNAETFLFGAAFGGLLLQARPPLPNLRVIAPFVFYYAASFFAFGLLLTWPEFRSHGGDLIQWIKELKANLWPSLLFFIAWALAPQRSSRRIALNCLVLSVLVFTVSGIIDYTGAGAAAKSNYRAAGTLSENPNILGAPLAAFCFVPLMIALDRRRAMPMRGFAAGVYALAVVVTILTLSRGAWLALVTGHGVWLFLTNRKLLIPAAATAVTVLLVAYSASLLPTVVSDRIEATITPGRSIYRSGGLAGRFDSSIDVRLARHSMGAEMFMDSPLYGHGYNSFSLLTREYGLKYGLWRQHTQGRSASAESMLLMITADHGLVGYLGVLWMSWMLLSRALALVRRGGEEARLGVAFISAFFAVAAASATQTALLVHEVSLPFWLLAGLVVRASSDPAHESEPEPALQPVSLGVLQAQRFA